MGYFRKDWQTELISDASPVGLGGVLCQFNPKDSHAETHSVHLLPTPNRGGTVTHGVPRGAQDGAAHQNVNQA